MIKKNNGRKEISVVMKDYFEKCVNIAESDAIQSSTAAPSSTLPLPSFSTASLQWESGCTIPLHCYTKNEIHALKSSIML